METKPEDTDQYFIPASVDTPEEPPQNLGPVSSPPVQDATVSEPQAPSEPETVSSTDYTPDDPRLLDALGWQESKNKPEAIGPMTKYGQAHGEFQFLEGTWKQYGTQDIQDAHNSDLARPAAQKYLNHLYTYYNKDINLALAGYNYGEGNLDKSIGRAAKALNKDQKDITFSDVTPYIPDQTKNYVPGVLGRYSKSSPELAKKINAAKLPGVIDSKGFAQLLSPIVSSPEYQALSAPDQIGVLNSVYQKNIYGDDVKETLKKLSDSVWAGATPEEIGKVRQSLGRPSQEEILAQKKSPDEFLNQWKDNKTNEIQKMGIAPELLAAPLNSYFDEVKKDETQAYDIRSTSYPVKIAELLGSYTKEAARGGLQGVASMGAFLMRTLGANPLATQITKVPDSLIGPPSRLMGYETYQNGYLVLNDDGTPRPTWQTNLFRSVGNMLTFLGGGAAVKFAGAGPTTIKASLFAANLLQNGESVFENVYQATGDVKKSYYAALLASPAAVADTALEASILSKFASTPIQWLSKFNQLKVFASEASKGAFKGALAGSAQDFIMQQAEISQTGANYDPKRTGEFAGVAAAVGGIAQPAFAGVEAKGLENARTLAKDYAVKSIVNEDLQSFQDSHASEKLMAVKKDYVSPEVTDAMGMDTSDNGDGTVTVTKKNFIPDESTSVEGALDNTLKYYTPDEIKEMHEERGDLIQKAKEEGPDSFTKEERQRLNELDERLKGTTDPSYINKIRANEAEYLRKIEEDPESIKPNVKWDNEEHVWKDGEGKPHPFLKGALGKEDFGKLSKDPASVTRPRETDIPRVFPQKPLSENFVHLKPHEQTSNEILGPSKVLKAIDEIGNIAAKGAGLPAFTTKEGGRLKKGEAGLARLGVRSIRLRSLRDIPTRLHEIIHAIDRDLNDITYKAAVNNKTLAEGLMEHSRTFYPGDKVQKDKTVALREGLTTFLENKLLRAPVQKDVLNWWEGEFKQDHPELYKAYQKVDDLASAYYSQSHEALSKGRTLDERPSRARRFINAITDINNWRAAVDHNYLLNEVDKAMGIKNNKYAPKSLRGFTDANANSAILIAQNLVNGEHFTDFIGNRYPDQKTFEQIKESLSPEQGEVWEEYLDLKNAQTMIKRGQNPGDRLSKETVKNRIADIEKREDFKVLEQKAIEFYKWTDKTVDTIVAASPRMRKDIAKIREANFIATGETHGFYVPFERQERDNQGGSFTREGNVQTPSASYGRKGSDLPLKPFKERIENLVTNLTNRSLLNQLIDRLILDNQTGKATGGMLERVTGKNALVYQTTYENALKQAEIAIKKEFGVDASLGHDVNIGHLAGEAGTSPNEILNTMIQWWHPETQLPGSAAAKGYMILARPKAHGPGYEFYEVHPNLLEAFSGPERTPDNAFIATSRLAKKLVQVSATTFNPIFQMRNIVRDPQAFGIVGEKFSPMKLANYMAQEAYDQIVTKRTGRSNSWAAVAQNLGLFSSTYQGAMREINASTARNGVVAVIGNTFDKGLHYAEFITSLGEQATRLAVMRMKGEQLGIDISKNPKITALQAIELSLAYKNSTVNFSKKGRNKTVNFLSDTIPFFGARLAAISQTIEGAQANPVRAATLGTAMFALGAYSYLNNAGKKWYDELSGETKASMYTMDIGEQADGRPRTVGIPLDNFQAITYGLGQVFARQTHENLKGGDVEANDIEMMKNVMQQFSPIDLPIDKKGVLGVTLSGLGPVGKVFAEEVLNYSIYRGRPIVNEKKPTQEQFTEGTAEMMKSLGRISGMSPDKIEYFVNSFASGPLKIEKFFEKQTGVKPINEDEGVNFFLRAFTREASNAMIQDQSRDKFYQTLSELNQGKSEETEEQGNSRKLVARIAKKITDLNHRIGEEDDKIKRDRLYAYRRELMRTGVRAKTNPNIEIPTEDSEEVSKE